MLLLFLYINNLNNLVVNYANSSVAPSEISFSLGFFPTLVVNQADSDIAPFKNPCDLNLPPTLTVNKVDSCVVISKNPTKKVSRRPPNSTKIIDKFLSL